MSSPAKDGVPKTLRRSVGKQYFAGFMPPGCQICNRPWDKVMIDGTTRSGPWALMDEDCHKVYGYGLGIGLGQKFVKQADGKWLKVA